MADVQAGAAGEVTVLSVDGVSRVFRQRGRQGQEVLAVDHVSLLGAPGTTIGVVGESGCGKTTLGRIIAGLVAPTSGTVKVRSGKELVDPAKERGVVQMIYQSPSDSLDPRLRVRDSVAEPLLGAPRKQGTALAETALESVGLVGLGRRYPHELSGGQQQRVCIARAMIAEPSVVVLDEAVSALDVLLQAEVLGLLREVQGRTAATFIFISHDLAAVRALSDHIVVMYIGAIVEVIPRHSYSAPPLHPYTVALHSAELIDGEQGGARRIVLKGDPPSNTQRHVGCRFATRCPVAADLCRREAPLLADAGDGKQVACHFPGALSPLSGHPGAAGHGAPS